MQSDDATEPLAIQELRRSLNEWAAISAQMIELLHETVDSERSRNWRPHFEQILNAIRAFGDRCREEAQEFDLWAAQTGDPNEAFERVRDQGQRLVDWLHRMIPD